MHLRRHIPLGWAISLAILVAGTVIMVGLILGGVFASTRALNIGMPVYYLLCLAAGVLTLCAGIHNRQRGWGLIGAAAITWTLGACTTGSPGSRQGCRPRACSG